LEVKHIHSWLSVVEISDHIPDVKLDEPEPQQVLPPQNIIKPVKIVQPTPSFQTEDKISDAIKQNDIKTLMQLFEEHYEPKINPYDQTYVPAVQLAVSLQNIEIVKYLLELGTQDINSTASENRRTPLHCAMALGNTTIAELLLNACADPTLKDAQGKSAFQVSKNKETGMFLRHFAGLNPDKWDWNKAVVTPLTQDEVQKRKEEKTEKNRKKKRKSQGEEKRETGRNS